MVELRWSGRRSIALATFFVIGLVLAVGQSPASAAVPIVRPDAYSTPMNVKLVVAAPGVLANDSDADGNQTMEAGMPTDPAHGTLRLAANGSFTYTPKTGFVGTDSFTYMVMEASNKMPTGTVTITVGGGGPALPTLAVNDVRVTEPNTGATVNAVFTITRTGATTGSSTVKYLTTGGTAIKGTDYTGHPLTTVTFAPGETTKQVTVKVLGDNVDEPNETFFVKLSAPTGATITDVKGIGTIIDND